MSATRSALGAPSNFDSGAGLELRHGGALVLLGGLLLVFRCRRQTR